MRLPPIRITIRGSLLGVAIVAVFLALIRHIEVSHHQGEVARLATWEAEWRQRAEAYRRDGENRAASNCQGIADEAAAQRAWHQGQFGLLPRSFTRTSAVVTLFYAWATALAWVLWAEHKRGAPFVQASRSRFIRWFALAIVAPIAMMLLALAYWERSPGLGRDLGAWQVRVVEGLFWLQVAYVLTGIIVLGGRRWGATKVGFATVMATGWIAIHCGMAVTGAWF